MNNFVVSCRKFLFTLMALSLTTAGTAFADTPQLKSNTELPTSTVVASTETAVPAKPESSYAMREQQSQQQAEFRGGGSGIYLSGTALVVALIVLIILL